MFIFLIPVLLGLGAATILVDGVLETVLIAVIDILAWFIKIIFMPINVLLDTAMPESDALLGYIQPMFDSVGSVVGWLLNSVFLTGAAVSLIVTYYIFTNSVSALLWSVKLLFKWKQAIQ